MQRLFAFLLLALVLVSIGCNRKIYNTPTILQLEKEAYLSKLAATSNRYVLDVRTRMEYKKGHIDGALSMSILDGFDEKIELLDTSRTVFIYCETAHRSPFATMKLKRVGFTRIYDLEGGYSVLRPEE